MISPLSRLRDALRRVLEGKPEVVDGLLIGALAGGHVLLEDVPGVGKTTLAKGLARALEVSFARVQLTPDLLPSDILGAQVLNPRDGTLTFHRGPVFTHVLLADELNRASPRTQSALLEAMSEAQVTVDGQTYPLPSPFLVVATQNPADAAGTFPLPEAQLDRFLLRLSVGYPAPDAELRMLYAHQRGLPLDDVPRALSAAELLALQATVRDVRVTEDVARYALSIVAATRAAPSLELGASPRGALALFRAAQARATLSGRDYATPDDVSALAVPVLAHRVRMSPDARYGGATPEVVVRQLVSAVDVPT
ncbi:MAG: MoxR family ATPase [Polyangiaceae bacterium]|nr:MoxR family ATPase [Polyangiaceae bacterium]